MSTLEAVVTDNYTIDELQQKVRELKPVDLHRLKKFASYLTGGHGLDEEDLLQEAITRVLAGDRQTCPKRLNIVSYMMGVIKSIASGEREKLANTALDDIELDNMPSGAELIEAAIISQDAANKLQQEVEELFKDDEEALLVILYRVEGYTAEEIREMESMDKTRYDTISKRIRRKIDVCFPGRRIS